MNPTARIIILSQEPKLSLHISEFLNKHEDLDVIGTYPSTWDFPKITDQLNPNLVIVLIPPVTDSEFKEKIAHIASKDYIEILAIIEEIPPRDILELMLQGINGFIHKNHEQHELIRSIHLIIDRGISISPMLMKGLFEFLRNPVVKEKSKKLTDKEFQVLAEIRKGRSYKEVADHFNLGESTIRTHCKSIYRKLGVRGRIEAINSVFLIPGLRNHLLNPTG